MVNAQAGDQSDYQNLLRELSPVIHNFLCRRFGNHHFIEDCVQEILIAIHQARHTYDPGRPFRPWMFAIVRHKAIDILRQQRSRENTINHYKTEQDIRLQAGDRNEPESELLKARLLDLLTPQNKELLVLTKVIGFSVAETSDMLGISQNAVKVRVFRAVRKLRLLLAKDNL